jgi:hypothetical protein
MDRATPLHELRQALAALPAGPILEAHRAEVTRLLAAAWAALPGGDATRMVASKLHRVEDLHWEPPCLTFTLARHGGTVHGSTREDLHQWQVDVAQGTALLTRARRFRQVVPRAPAVDVAPLVDRIVAAIAHHASHPAVEVLSPTRVRVVATRMPELGLRAAFQRTAATRRTRFRERLTQQLAVLGWVTTANTARMEYERVHPEQPDSTSATATCGSGQA